MTCAGELKVPSVFGSVVRSNEMFGRISFCKVYPSLCKPLGMRMAVFLPTTCFFFSPTVLRREGTALCGRSRGADRPRSKTVCSSDDSRTC